MSLIEIQNLTKMKRLFILLIATSIVLFTSCDQDDALCLKGSGSVNNYGLTTDAFTEVSLIGPVNLRIRQGQNLSLDVDAEPEIFAALSYSVKNGVLEIGFEENVSCFETDYGVWVNVTAPNIIAIYQSGVSEIISDGDLILPELELNVSGTANVSLSGQVQDQFIESSGILTTTNFELHSRNCWLDISGSADVEVSCSDKMKIEVDGSAKISYKGAPTISQEVSGELELIDAN